MIRLLRLFRESTSGATAIEYAFVAGLVSIAIVVAATSVGTKLNAKFQGISTALN